MGNAVSRTDSGFGPILDGKSHFTILFEESIFTIAPAIVAILALIVQILSIASKPMLVRLGPLLGVKTLLGTFLVGCDLATLILWTFEASVRTETTLPAAGLALAGSAAIVMFLILEHLYNYRPSTFVSLFMSVTLLFDMTKTYSCFHRIGLESQPICAMYIVSCVLRFLLLLCEEVSKRRFISRESLRLGVGREAVSGFWTRSLFLWLNSTLFIGFRHALKVEDLPSLAPEFHSKTAYEAFRPQWERVDKRSKFALVKACILAQAVPFVTITIPRLCQIGFTLAQPLLLLRATRAIEEKELPNITKDGLIGATVLIYFGIAITKGYSTHLAYQVTTSIRGMLTVAIYDKMFYLSHEVLAESAAVTLMSTDLNGLERIVPLFHDVWAAVVELGLGLLILGKIAGPSCLLFLVPGIITTVGTSIVTKKMMKARASWNEKIQSRVAKTSNVIAQLKLIKMAGLSQPMLSYIERLRAVELTTSMRERNLRVIVGGLNAFNRALAPVIVVAGALFWTRAGGDLSSNEIYTILAVVAIVSQPLATILLAVPSLSGSLASFPRLQKFLCREEVADNRSKDDSQNLSIKAANVSVNSELSRPIVQDVNLEIPSGTVAMITGPVGCGKTTLLKALIGEVQLEAGSRLEIKSSPIGYSDQTSWLENTTIRENICHDDFNATLYKEVLVACDLDHDLDFLPLGDQTMVGANGSNLSGGQRQRVALCRAIYCEAPLLVLDDPLSAVDATTSSIIIQRLFGEDGLLRRRKATVIMTTSSNDLCSAADSVFTISSDGDVQRLPAVNRDAMRPPRQQEENGQLDKENHTVEKEHSGKPAVTVPNPSVSTSAKDEKGDLRKGDRALYSYYLGSVKRSLLILSLLLIIMSSVSDRTPVIFLRIWLDKDPENNLYFIGYAALGVSKIVFASLSWHLYFRNIFMGTATALHKRLVTATIGATSSSLSGTDPGSILSRFSQDMTLIAQNLPIFFLNAFYSFITVLLEIAIICAGAKFVATVIPGLLVVVYIIQHFYLRTSRQLRVRELETKAPLFTKFTETSSGIQHIRAFQWQEAFTLKMQAALDYSLIPYYTLFCVQRWLTLVLDLITCAVATMLVTLALEYRRETSDNALGLSMLSVVTFSGSLGSLLESWTELEISLGAIARLKMFCFGTPQERDDDKAQHIPEHWPSTGRIEFRGVSASYMKLDGSAHQVLDNLSFDIDGGKNLGISGRTGSGKSTILAVLLRMIEYTGSILIDGVELRTIPHGIVRSRFTTLSQDGIRLQESIRLNLDPYSMTDNDKEDRIPAESMIHILTRIGLWGYINQQGGLELDMSAANFSQGQLQLFDIARAMLRKSKTASKIVLLDEVTSSADSETEKRMQDVIADVFSNCTICMVSHRRDATDKMDKVITLKNGQVVNVSKHHATGTDLSVEAN